MRNTVLLIELINLLKKFIGFTFLFLIITISSSAQKGIVAEGKIKGRIIDSISGQPVEYATVSLFTQKDNKVVNGTTTDLKGVFTIDNVSEGTYKLNIDFMGYKKKVKNFVVVSKQHAIIIMGDIKLSQAQYSLNEVNVVADKSIIENKIDKMVYNAEKDITSQTGVASDVLKKVPQVSVDVDGNVELQGNSNIRFLIDGKPSVLFGSNITDVLQSIPASQIQSIEIITSPGAKYDAEGSGGIINIILKKSKARGINCSTSLSGGTRMENGSFNINVRNGNFGAHAWLSGNAQLLSTTVSQSNRTTKELETTSRLIQNGTGNFTRNGYQSGLGFDWDITPKDNISGSLGYNYMAHNTAGNTNTETLLQDASSNLLSDIKNNINTTNKFHQHSYNWDLRYKKKFNLKDQELEVLVNSSNADLLSYYEQTQKFLSSDSTSSSYGNNPGTSKETNIEVNYTQPLGENASFETGAKTVIDNINSTSDVYLLSPFGRYDYNTSQSSSVEYNRNIYAAYFTATFRLFRILDLKPGIRDEYTMTNAAFSNVGNVSFNPYNTVVPSIVISHTFKNNQNLKVSYSHRIQRPDYRDLNPFINASDPYNVTTGNPNLHPETGDKIELSYIQTSKSGITFNSTLFYRGNRNDIQQYVNFYHSYKIGDSTYNNITVTTRENIGKEDNYGLNLFISVPIKDKLNIRSNLSCYERYIVTGLSSGGNVHGINYRINLNASYQLTSTFVVEMFGNFNSSRLNAQGTLPSFTTYNFAFRKQFLNKKASIALTANNFFDKYVNQKTELTGTNFTISNLRQIPFRSIGFNITYRFGKMEFRKVKDSEENNLNSLPEN